MTWVRLEDRFPWHRKVRGLSDAAFRLHVSGICWSAEHLTDGQIPKADLALVSDVKRPGKALDELLARDVWKADGDGYQIHDYLVYNQTAEQVRAERTAAAERQRRAREAARQKRDGQAKSPGESRRDSAVTSPDETVPPSRPVPSRPVDNPPPTPSVSAPSRGTRIPDVFPFDPEHGETLRVWAETHTPAVALKAETENWQDYHRAKGDTAKDWTASWRTWMRRAQQDAERRPGRLAVAGSPSVRPSTTDTKVAGTLQLAEHFRQQDAS